MSQDEQSDNRSLPRFWTKSAGFLLATLFVIILLVDGWRAAEVAAQADCGVLAYEWDKNVTESDKGFPRQQPPISNFNWTTPVDYANGTLYYRVMIKSQPVAKDMKLQLCFWQPVTPTASYKFGLENCGPQQALKGEQGTVVTWQKNVQDMWKKDGNLIDWTRPRFRTAVAVKNSAGQPVSDYNGWNWYNENPKEWYPLNMHFTTVVVPAGGQFCGWDYYLNPTAVSLQSVTTQQAPNFVTPLLFAILSIITLLVWKIRLRKS